MEVVFDYSSKFYYTNPDYIEVLKPQLPVNCTIDTFIGANKNNTFLTCDCVYSELDLEPKITNEKKLPICEPITNVTITVNNGTSPKNTTKPICFNET